MRGYVDCIGPELEAYVLFTKLEVCYVRVASDEGGVADVTTSK